jgi:hypothetical protein
MNTHGTLLFLGLCAVAGFGIACAVLAALLPEPAHRPAREAADREPDEEGEEGEPPIEAGAEFVLAPPFIEAKDSRIVHTYQHDDADNYPWRPRRRP